MQLDVGVVTSALISGLGCLLALMYMYVRDRFNTITSMLNRVQQSLDHHENIFHTNREK